MTDVSGATAERPDDDGDAALPISISSELDGALTQPTDGKAQQGDDGVPCVVEAASPIYPDGGGSEADVDMSDVTLPVEASVGSRHLLTHRRRQRSSVSWSDPSDTPAQPLTKPATRKKLALLPGLAGSVLQLQDGTLLQPKDVVALSFEVFAETSRENVEGQLLIVKQSKCLSRVEWKTWLLLMFDLLMVSLVGCQLVGPITTVVMTVSAMHYRRPLAKFLEHECQWDPQQQTQHFALAVLVCTFWILATWITPLLFNWIVSTLVLIALTALLFWKKDALVCRVALHPDWRMPSVSRPIIVNFPRAELSDMLLVREQLFLLPSWRNRMLLVSVGSYWVETISSGLLYSDIYNSRRARFISFLFFTYVLPVVFALQVLGLVGPWLWRKHLIFMALVRADFSVKLLRFFLRSFSFLHVPEVVYSILDMLSMPAVVMAQFFSTISSVLVPFDKAITYVQARLQPFRIMFLPLQMAVTALFNTVASLFGSVSGPFFMFIRFSSTWASRLCNADRVAARMRENPTFRKINSDLNKMVKKDEKDV